MIRTVLIDDHHLIVSGLHRLLSDDGKFEVVRTFTSGLEFLDDYKSSTVDLIIIDIELPDINGLDVIRRVRHQDKGVKIIVLSMHEEGFFRLESINAGANNYFPKSGDSRRLIDLISETMEGEQVLKANNKPSAHGPLSHQEQEILRRIAGGSTTSEIASQLHISPLTVKTHRKNILRKLDAPNTAGLISMAYDKGLI
ncbi:MAG: response regulator transcription factor [Cyclobacteriaceae bacterium]|nr:response regulator transcription factor [Cyclobacteriaceae bacterium]